MKISSASKKVLASALSAAMVVAFAPTVAFADKVNTADTVTVTYDLNGGSLANDNNPLTGEIIQVQKGVNTDNGDVVDHLYLTTTKAEANKAKVAGPSGYSISGWFVDANNDGVKGSDEAAITTDGDIDLTQYKISGNAITLKAYYDMPSISAVNFAAATSSADAKIAATLSDGKTGHKYILTVTLPDGSTCEQVFGAGTGEVAVDKMDNAANTTVTFEENPDSTAKMVAYKSQLTAGDYTVALTEDGKVISSETIKLVSVTVKDGVNTPAKDDLVSLWQLADGKATASVTLTSGEYLVNGEGYAVDARSFEVKENTVLTTTKTVQVAANFTYTDRSATVTLTDGSADEGDSYAVSVVDPNNDEVYTATVKAAKVKAAKDTDKDTVSIPAVSFSFDQTANGARASKEEVAGTYVATVTKTAKADGAVSSSKKDMVLSQVVYDLGEAKVKDSVKTSEFTTAAKVTAATWSNMAEYKDHTFDKWSVNGKTYAEGKEIKLEAGKVNTIAAIYKDVDYASTPTFSVSKVMVGTTAKYYLTISGTATGETVKYTIEDASKTAYAGPVELTPSKYIEVEVTANKKTPKVVKLVSAIDADKNWAKNFVGAGKKLELTVGNTGSKWLASAGVKAALESGKASFAGLAEKFFVEDEAVAATELAADKALYEAVAAEADAQLKAYDNKANVIAGKKVYYMDAAQFAANSKNIANAEKAVADKIAKKGATDAEKTTAYKAGVDSIVTAANTALKNATENTKVAVADVEAAAKASEALKAAKTADEAKVALEAYAALTEAQKALVATADVQAAQKIVSDAEMAAALKDAQDEAAIGKVKGKTVKAKAKKTTKSSLKVVTSKSGAKSTFKKVKGTKKVTVSKTGKITVKKGLKAGKKYTVKVKAKIGTQTKTVKVTVKVAK